MPRGYSKNGVATWKGKKHTAEARKKMSVSRTRCFLSAEIIQNYHNGKPAIVIGKELGFCPETIINALHRNGIETRGKGRPLSEEPSRCYFRCIAIKTLKVFGYKLKQGEVIHHIDRNPQNNNINNLLIFKNNSQHIRWHRWGMDRHPNDDGWARLARAIGIKTFMGISI